jgi:hypothetical protein
MCSAVPKIFAIYWSAKKGYIGQIINAFFRLTPTHLLAAEGLSEEHSLITPFLQTATICFAAKIMHQNHTIFVLASVVYRQILSLRKVPLREERDLG